MRFGMPASILALLAGVLLLGSGMAYAHPHNSVDIIAPPAPVFPDNTVAPGRCEVRFDISEYTTINIRRAECSDLIFCKPAKDAVEAAKLKVVDNNGEEGAGNARNVLYPLRFTFGQPSQGQLTWIRAQPLFPCDDALMF